MPEFEVKAPQGAVHFTTIEDWVQFMRTSMYNVGLTYGFRLTVEPIAKPARGP